MGWKIARRLWVGARGSWSLRFPSDFEAAIEPGSDYNQGGSVPSPGRGPLEAFEKQENSARRRLVLKEFKEFAMRGSVLDLAVGVIIGAAFGKVVSSLVDDVIMPPIGRLLGHVDFSQLFINLTDQSYASLAEAKKAGAATLNYGNFINTVISFLIVAAAVFLLVRSVNRWMPKPPPATTKDCPQCAMAIPVAAKKCGHCTSTV
jgi:large conductance mechanosensitive channel